MSINKLTITILFFLQDAAMALTVTTRGYLLENGRVDLAEMTARMSDQPLVEKAYLGG